jgi:uncharacterized protein
MKILIDIGHPAHVHYFRNLIEIMKSKGHEFLVTARDKEITLRLLELYKIPFVSRGKGGNGVLQKMLYILRADLFIYNQARIFKPDIFLSFASTYSAHASKLYGKPHVALDDTEHAKFEIFLYKPFTDTILTPSCFLKNFGPKQIRFNAYVEFAYLHKKFLQLDNNIHEKLGLKNNQKFVLFRFVSWNASHDIGHSGIQDELKKRLIQLFLDNHFEVFVSSENPLSEYFEKFRLKTDINEIHSVIAKADWLIGESGTMSTEACILGTPAIFVNSLDAGVFQEEEKIYQLLYSYRTSEKIIEKIATLIKIPNLKEEHLKRAEKLREAKINLTEFLVWFIENYPESKNVMKRNIRYQDIFK